MKGLQKLKLSKTYLNEIDLDGITQLMDNGFSVSESMQLLDNRHNHEAFRYINDCLLKGQAIEEVFIQVLPKRFQKFYGSFINFLPFLASLHLTLNIETQLKQTQREIKKQCLYPAMMFIGTLIGIYVFSRYFLPSLISMMISFKTDTSIMVVVQKICLIGSVAIMILLVISLFIVVYYLVDKNQVKGYLLIRKLNQNSLIVKYISRVFAQYFLECIKLGEGTKQTFSILRSLSNQPVISYLANNIDNDLKRGNSFTHALNKSAIEDNLLQFLNIGMHSNRMQQMLETYLTTSKQVFNSSLKSLTKLIQLCSYISIGVVLVLVYQILLLPLQIMSQM